ncbi:MAG: hypothetical protein NZ899_03845 [Thermoguttaceae bacterium]|nr:hypothetical protein [Thermoguttaceae bacterium]MDW8077734.1 hypothetical protein [Thermoguttaceae bacterium]
MRWIRYSGKASGGAILARKPAQEVLRHRRLLAGLAMMELVLALPLLLLMMVLIINYGTAASWKVRSLAAARHAVWSSRWPRSGLQLPRPEYWPASASLGVSGGGKLASLDDPRVNHPVVRGPLPNGFVVRDQLLDPGRGLLEGSADLTRRFPLASNLPPYQVNSRTQLVQQFWDHREMGLFTTNERRVPVLYELPKASAAYADAYRQAALAILYAPFRPALAPLDRDDEFIAYAKRFNWRIGPPDFHPRLHRFCSLDHTDAQKAVARLMDDIEGRIVTDSQGNRQRIGGVPQNMVEAFIALYTQVIHELQNQLAAGVPPQVALSIRGEIQNLQDRIALLQQYLNELRNAVD